LRLAKYTVSGLSLLSCVDEDFISFIASSPKQRLGKDYFVDILDFLGSSENFGSAEKLPL